MALYADDMLLFLHDAGPYLLGALWILDTFSNVTGLKGNLQVSLGKSVLFPIDDGALIYTPKDLPLQWVHKFCFFGVIVSCKASNYVSLNLLPVMQEVKARLKAWGKLPLPLIGHINLLKMKILKILKYFFV